MKKMISQTKELNTMKCHNNDYTDVSTQNNSQHSVDSSFSEKSTGDHNVVDNTFEEEQKTSCESTIMQDQTQVDEKQTKIEFYKKSVQWLGRKYKRFKIKIQTLYLSISYLIKFISVSEQLKYKYEVLSAVCLLLASKVNEIHFPSIKSILGSLDFLTTKRQILQIQQQLLELFDFQMGVQRNSYSIVHQFFKSQEQEKRKNAEKLLFLSISNPQTLQFGQTYLGLSITYLLNPQALKNLTNISKDKLKKIALIVYKMYKQKKNQQLNKEN